MSEIWFWQRTLSPHMAGLVAGMAARGHAVNFVAERAISEGRVKQGWKTPDTGEARLHMAPDLPAVSRLAADVSADATHIFQGFRGNGLVGVARRALMARRIKHWVVMEAVDNAGWRGAARRLAYRRLLRQSETHLAGILAIGHRTPSWLVECGANPDNVFPFAYFLPDNAPASAPPNSETKPFQILFVGALIERKRVDLLLSALRCIAPQSVELTVIGVGPLEAMLRVEASAVMGKRLKWLGRQPMDAIASHMAQADCLVLPSRHDGWGAVVSEALMAGTRAICTDRCGAAEAVYASGLGAVVPYGDVAQLANAISCQIALGRPTPDKRAELAAWARCLGAKAGAAYLDEILDYARASEHSIRTRPSPPWAGPTSTIARTL
ncbi:glycosyltransferase family 4 protein [Sphingomonas flavalba]|uniref:glycosyltransferase family 4 protein n=1 Tax=Sphingomonas flavalba TaxID=2559804 RepID=UPI00109DE4E6|nr:glycosyltransferase family 4 protein [Sphingomonas flavalba]